MSQPAAVRSALASSSQPLVITLVSMAVIALTALVLQWLTVPAEVTTSLSTASGALVPAIAIHRREQKKGKADRILELVTGTFRRPPVYVLIIAAGILGLIEYFTAIFFVVIGYLPLIDAEIAGFLTAEESEKILSSEASTATSMAVLLGLAAAMIIAVPVGSYVAHRIGTRPLYWAIGAVVLYESLSLLLETVVAASSGWMVNYWAFPITGLLLSIAVSVGVWRGRRTRALFLATRLFRRLSEADRGAVLALMQETQVAKRLSP